MAQNTEVKVLKISLLVVGLLWLIGGLSSFFAPAMIGKLIVGNQVDLIMFRLIGGLHIALGIGTLMVYSKPEKQGIFVLTIALANLLAGLAFLGGWIMHEYTGGAGSIAIFACLALVLSALVFWGRSQARDIL